LRTPLAKFEYLYDIGYINQIEKLILAVDKQTLDKG
jgi:hypothetical protein